MTSQAGRSPFGPLARILVVLTLAHFPWPGLGRLFAEYFSLIVTPLLSLFASNNTHLSLYPAAPPSPLWSVMIDASNVWTRRAAQAVLDVRRVGWLPLGTFAALLVAFPVRHWQRRALVAVIGMVMLHALWVLPALAAFGSPAAGFFEVGEVGYTLAVVGQRALVTLPGMAYALSALLWFVLTWSLERELM